MSIKVIFRAAFCREAYAFAYPFRRNAAAISLSNGISALALLFAFAVLLPISAIAQEKTIPGEYAKLMRERTTIKALDVDLFGDSVSPSTHELEFDIVDVSVPGNNALPVEFRRHRSIRDQDGQLGGLGEWNVDVPFLSGIFAKDAGWQVGTSSPNQRCTLATKGFGAPPSYPNFLTGSYWYGNSLHIPGAGDQEMLETTSASPMGPGGTAYSWMTKSLWYFGCLPSTKNGYAGEGFLAISPSGDRYYFDWVIKRASRPVSAGKYYSGGVPHCNGSGGGNNCNELPLYRETVYFVATKVEDRFGNWVAYDWTSDRLNSITSNDGRAISIQYDPQNAGRVAAVTTSNDSWSYAYDGEGNLASVGLPDGSQWTYSGSGGYAPGPTPIRFLLEPQYEYVSPTNTNCLIGASEVTPFTYNVQHPSGAKGVFTVELGGHGRTNVEKVCAASTGTPGYYKYPPRYEYMALTKREISGPGLSTLTWTYSSESNVTFPFCQQVGSPNCPSSRNVTVTEPDGTQIVSTYGIAAQINEGQLLRTQTVSSDGTLMRDETSAYITNAEATSQPFPDRIGKSDRSRGDWFSSEAQRPVKQRSIAQDGAALSSAIQVFDALARPVTVERSSSWGNTIKETTAYHDNLVKWMLGQVRTLTCDAPASCAGKIEAQTDYESSTALPLRTYRFGKLFDVRTYNGDGTIATISDGRDTASFDTTLTFSNWKRGIPQMVAYPATPDQPSGESKSAVVSDDGTIASVADENSYTTSYQYDALGRLTQISYPTGDSPAWAVTTQVFSTSPDASFGLPAGHWKQTVKTGNGTRIVHFDAFWRPVVEESFDNGSPTLATSTHSYVVKRYDTTGRLVFQSYPLRALSDYTAVTAGVTTTYDALDRVKKTSVPSTDSTTGTFVTTTAYASDATGAYTLVTDPMANQTRTWFQMFDQPDYSRPVKITQPEGVITDIARDVFGKPTSMTRHDASNSVVSTRTYTYNANQELCRTVEPETGATLVGYDAAGNLAWSAAGYASTTACGGPENVAARRVDRTYDARNRLKTLVFPGHLGDTTTTYTPDGLVASLVADNGSSNVVTTAYTYNRRRLLIGERMTWNAINWPIVYGYDANGNAANLTYPDSTYVDYAPNALGQATKVGTYATNVTYHPNGAIAQFSYGNGIVHAMTQNDRQLPDRSRDAFDGAPAVVALDDNYSYDGNGNVVAILDGIAGAPSDRTMQYDGLNRLTKATSPLFNDGTANEARYSYDVLDNISTVHMRDRNHFYCYDTATWRLTNIKTGYCSSGATVVGLGYDVQGNVTNKNGQMFAFDYGNRLRSTSNNSTPVSSYVYDGLGRRVRDYTTASKYSLYSNDGRIVYASDGRAGKVTTNVYLGNSLLAELEKDTATAVVTTRYMHTDALGSVVALSNASRYLNRNSYEPYGELINRANYDRPGFTGHVMDAATDLTYAQQRYYDPGIGRFLSVDPVTAISSGGTNFNRYWYANNNPYRFTDPDGRLSRGTGFDDKQWKTFDKAQQGAAKSLEKAAAKITRALDTGKGMKGAVRAFEKNFGAGSATPENMAQVASDMSSMASALRDTGASAIPANGMSASAMTTAYSNMTPDVMAGVPTSGNTQVIVNLDHSQYNNRSLLTWGVGHETGHAVLGYSDQKVNGVPAYKFGTPAQQQAYQNLPGPQRLINPDNLMDQAR